MLVKKVVTAYDGKEAVGEVYVLCWRHSHVLEVCILLSCRLQPGVVHQNESLKVVGVM